MNNRAFTLVELLTVITIIGVLASLVLMTVGYVQRTAAKKRAEAEIKSMEAASEAYKADNGIYPRGPAAAMTVGAISIAANATDSLNPRTSGNPSAYGAASLYLYTQLSGDADGDAATDSGARAYMEFNPNMLGRVNATTPPSAGNRVTSIQDPFGLSYGYSTAYVKWQEAGGTGKQVGYNPTFDLWSTTGKTTTPDDTKPTTDVTNQWIKNW